MLPVIINQHKELFVELIETFPNPYDLGVEILKGYLIAEGVATPGKFQEEEKKIKEKEIQAQLNIEKRNEMVAMQVLEKVSGYRKISINTLLKSKTKVARVARTRQLIQCLVIDLTGLKLANIERLFNKVYKPCTHAGWQRANYYNSRKKMMVKKSENRDLFELYEKIYHEIHDQ